MRRIINKKILFYFFLLIILGTINNKNIGKFELPKTKNIDIIGLELKDSILLEKNLEFIKSQNLFFLDNFEINKIMNANNLIEKYFIIKKYPSSLEIRIDKTKFLANLYQNEKNLILGSNGKLIESEFVKKQLPFIFGNFSAPDFFKLKSNIDKSNFKFEEVDKLYFFPSGRWDIETKSGLIIKLPKNGLKKSLELLTIILESPDFEDKKIIDIRQINQMVTSG